MKAGKPTWRGKKIKPKKSKKKIENIFILKFRVGLFSEVGYTTIGDKYPKVDPNSRPFNTEAYKKKQMLPGGSKTR